MRVAADDERLRSQVRLLELLHGGVEGVEVEMGQDRHRRQPTRGQDGIVIDAPPLPPPAIVAPAPREVSFGRVSGTVPAGTQRLVVRVGGRVVADRPLRGRSFSLAVPIVGADPASR